MNTAGYWESFGLRGVLKPFVFHPLSSPGELYKEAQLASHRGLLEEDRAVSSSLPFPNSD